MQTETGKWIDEQLRLANAAPDLLEALEIANELIPVEVRKCYQVPMIKIRAAIAKARGDEDHPH